MSSDWRDPDETPPDWGEYGRVALRRRNGTIEYGSLDQDALVSDDGDEVPISELTLDDGTKDYLHKFAAYRLLDESWPSIRKLMKSE